MLRSAAQRGDDGVFATVLAAASVDAPDETHAISFLGGAASGGTGGRDHATVGRGCAVTVATERWWLKCKVDGTGVLLHDLIAADPFQANVADENRAVVDDLFGAATPDAKRGFPDWILELARGQEDAPGCSELAAQGYSICFPTIPR